MRKWIVTLAGIAVSAIAIVIIATQTEWQQAAVELANVGWRLPLILVLIYLATFPIRAQRWQWMLPAGTQTFTQALKGVVLGFAGNNFLPARGGEFLRMEYLHRKVPHIGRVAALSSILVERMLDGLTLLAILVVAINAAHIPLDRYPWLNELRYVALAIFGLACLATIVARIWGTALGEWLRNSHAKPFQLAARLIERFHVAAAFLGFNRAMLAAIAAGFAVWLVEGGMFVVACSHFGLGSRSIVAGYLTLAIVNFGLLVPSSPGNVGVFEGMTILALGLFGVSRETALALGIVVHVCQYVPTTLWGLVILFRESVGLSRHGAAAARNTQPAASPHE